MRAVGVGVGHEDDPAVARRVDVEGAARPGADHLDDRGALGVLEHVGDGGLLHVEDLAADRQQRLELRVAGQLGRAERGVALDDEQLGAVDVVGPAVGELGRQRRGLQRVLAALGLAVLAGGEPGLGGAGDLLHDQLGLRPSRRAWSRSGTLFSSAATTLRTTDRAAGVPSTSLVWPSNCGSASRTVTTAVRPSSTSSLTTSASLALSTRDAAHRVVERLGQRRLEAGDVGAALGGGDHVDERAHLGLVARSPTARATSTSSSRSTSCGVMWPLSSSSGTVSVNESEPCSRSTSVTGSSWLRNSQNSVMPPSWRNDSVDRLVAAQVGERQLEAGDDERGLPGPGDQLVPGELRVPGEDLPVGPEPDPGAGHALLDPAALVQARLRLEAAGRPVAGEHARDAALEATSPGSPASGRPRRRAARRAR